MDEGIKNLLFDFAEEVLSRLSKQECECGRLSPWYNYIDYEKLDRLVETFLQENGREINEGLCTKGSNPQ